MSAASESLLRNAIRAAQPGGSTRRYFEQHGQWEAVHRQRFAGLSSRIFSLAAPDFGDESLSLLYALNGFYATRYSRRLLPEVNKVLVGAVAGVAGSDGGQTDLLASTEQQRTAMRDLVVGSLQAIERTGLPRPYSLMTKFIHFVMPHTFAIYDGQAATSIAAWAACAFGNDRQSNWRQLWKFSRQRMGSTSGDGYAGVLDFYSLVWGSAPAEARREAEEATAALQSDIRARYRVPLARFTLLDLIDKYLWKSGSPRSLRGERLDIAPAV
jgi:hypothetical protein